MSLFFRGDNLNETFIYDRYGKTIKQLSQWDQNVFIYFRDIANVDLMADPVIHFFSENDEVAYVTKATVEKDVLHTKIPDILLTLDKTIYGCVFCNDSEGQQSRYFFRIAIGFRPKPTTYIEPSKDYKDYYDVMEVLAACKEYAKSINLIMADISSYTKRSEDAAIRAENAADRAENAITNLDDKITEVNELLAQTQKTASDATELVNNYNTQINNAIEDAKSSVQEYVTGLIDATDAANAATTNANEAAELARQAAAQAGLERANMPKQWGVRFRNYRAGSSPVGERLGDAIGLVANVGTDTTENVQNDFDTLAPWQTYRVNGNWVNGNFVVTAKEGTSAFSTTNANTYALRNLFYYKIVTTPEYFEIWISDQLIPGYKVPKRFIKSNGKILDKYYYPCYKLARNSESDPTPVTRSGKDIMLRATAGEYQQWVKENLYNSNNKYHIETFADRQINELLFMVEFATLDSQSIMRGASNLPYPYTGGVWGDDSFIAKIESTNAIILPARIGAEFVVGQRIKIGTKKKGYDIVDKAIITNITDYASDSKKISFKSTDNRTITVRPGYWVGSESYPTGGTDSVKTPSGSPVSNTSGKYQCRYRYVEDLWGNQWSIMGEVYEKAGNLYYSSTPWKTSIDSTKGNYELTSTIIESQTDHGIYKLIQDNNHSDIVFPASDPIELEEYAPSESTYFCDSFFIRFNESALDVVGDDGKRLFNTQAKRENSYRCVCRGGGVYNEGEGGLFSVNCCNPREFSHYNMGTRLSYTP